MNKCMMSNVVNYWHFLERFGQKSGYTCNNDQRCFHYYGHRLRKSIDGVAQDCARENYCKAFMYNSRLGYGFLCHSTMLDNGDLILVDYSMETSNWRFCRPEGTIIYIIGD